MATIRKRTWCNKSGKHTAYEINYVIDGKQYKRGGYKTRIEAQLDLPNVVLDCSTDIKFGVLAKDYLSRHCELNCKPTTKALYENYLKVNLADLQRKIAKDISKRDFENLILKLKQKGLTNKTINGIITFVQAVLNYGVEHKFLKNNPVLKFKKLPQVKPPIYFLNEPQLEVFLRLAKDLTPLYYTFFATAVFTGMRRGELLGLEWGDIDFKKAKIKVNKQIYKGIKQATKTGKERMVDIPDNLLEILKEYKKSCKTLTKLIFHNKEGNPLHPYNMEQWYFHPLIRRCNDELDEENQIEKLRFHDLRHTYATYLLSKGIPVKYVQEQLGHSTARMTLDTYASVMPSVKFGALDLLQKIGQNEQNRTQIEHEKLKY